MSLNPQTIQRLPHVEAVLNYLAPMTEKPFNLGYEPAPGVPRQPVTRVHNDYTTKSGPQRVHDLMGEEAEELSRHRFQIVNVWRPIRGPLRDAPLAVADAGSVAFENFIASDLVYRDRTGETYNLCFNPAHRWFYAPEMRAEEAILIKSYDSLHGVARFTPHSSFEDPTAPAAILPRESIEVRMLVFHRACGRARQPAEYRQRAPAGQAGS
jgi:hypothetical protein